MPSSLSVLSAFVLSGCTARLKCPATPPQGLRRADGRRRRRERLLARARGGVHGPGRARRRRGLARLVAQAARACGRSLRALEVTTKVGPAGLCCVLPRTCVVACGLNMLEMLGGAVVVSGLQSIIGCLKDNYRYAKSIHHSPATHHGLYTAGRQVTVTDPMTLYR